MKVLTTERMGAKDKKHKHRTLQLGRPKTTYAIVPFAVEVHSVFIEAFLSLHDTISSILAYPAPSTLAEWDRIL